MTQWRIKEISDLENSMQNLQILITDLKENLHLEFKKGLEHIDTVFDSYIKKLFGGGGGKVSLVQLETKTKKDNTDDEENNDEDVENDKMDELKTGVDVEVTIPNKKIIQKLFIT